MIDFASRKAALLDKWRRTIYEAYAEEGRAHLTGSRSRFSNPIGLAIEEATASAMEYLEAGDQSRLRFDSLREIVKIRTIQGWSPSQVVGFLQDLKIVLLDELKSECGTEELTGYLLRIDRLMLGAFDIYSAERERLSDIRVNESRRRYARILERTTYLAEEATIHSDLPHETAGASGNNGASL